MNSNQDPIQVNRASGAAVGFILACLIFAGLAVVVKLSVKAPALDADRAAERAKDLSEIRATEDKALTTAAWIDQSHGIVRLPIEDAMRLVEQEGAASTRATLTWRVEQASAPAPAAPAK